MTGFASNLDPRHLRCVGSSPSETCVNLVLTSARLQVGYAELSVNLLMVDDLADQFA